MSQHTDISPKVKPVKAGAPDPNSVAPVPTTNKPDSIFHGGRGDNPPPSATDELKRLEKSSIAGANGGGYVHHNRTGSFDSTVGDLSGLASQPAPTPSNASAPKVGK